MKPMKASEADLATIKYPVVASPKLDGWRGVVHDGRLLANSLKEIPNRHTFNTFSHKLLEGFDGELIVGPPNAKDVYKRSTSALLRRAEEPVVTFYVFDITNLPGVGYLQRRRELIDRVYVLRMDDVFANVVVLESEIINNEEELLEYEAECLEVGYEGIMIRDPQGMYKYGRSTVKEGLILKLKRFTDSEATVIGFEEEMHNTNAAVKNELGRTKRSSDAAGLVGKGTLGALVCTHGAWAESFKVSGYTDAEAGEIWANRPQWMGAVIKFKYFPHGTDAKPRHPTYLGLRPQVDMQAAA